MSSAVNRRLAAAVAVVDAISVDRARLSAELNTAGALAVVTAPSLDSLSIPSELSPLALLLGADGYAEESALAEAMALARARFQPQTIVLMGHLSAVAAFAAARAGADALMMKPANASDVLALLGAKPVSRAEELPTLPSLARAEWEYLQYVLERCAGNRSRAAKRLGIHRSVLQRKLSRLPPSR